MPSGASVAPICATPPQTIASENRLASVGMWFIPFSTGRTTVSERMCGAIASMASQSP